MNMIFERRSSSLSYLRIWATIAVVVSHVWSTLTENKDMFVITNNERTFLDIGYTLTAWGVPAFFMISGALLLKKDKVITVHDCIYKYAKRMLLALFLFGIPYAFLINYFQNRHFEIRMLFDSFVKVINGDSFGHLWYLYTLIGVYLFLPIIKLFVNNASRQIFLYSLILIFIFNFCFPLINSIFGLKIAFKLPLTTYPIYYLLLGYYMFNERPMWANNNLIAICGIIVSVITTFLVCLLNGPRSALMSYSSPVVAVYTLSIFNLFIKLQKQSTNRLWTIDRLCFGVYLIHPLFIQFIYKVIKVLPTGNSFYQILSIIFAVCFVVISFFASWLMSLIKPLKKYVL